MQARASMGGMPRFLCDAMLGSLARWLRLLGLDTVFDAEAPDAELARRAAEEGRWLLTRDRELAASGPRTMLVRSIDLEDQLVEVLGRLGLEADRKLVGTRCTACNGVLRPVAPETVTDRVPSFVRRTAEEFRECPDCGRIYWKGSHVARIEARIVRVADRLEAFDAAG